MRGNLTVDHHIYRERADGSEQEVTVRCDVYAGCPATRMHPGDPAEIDVLGATDETGEPVSLTETELEDIHGNAGAEIMETAADEYDARREDAAEARAEQRREEGC